MVEQILPIAVALAFLSSCEKTQPNAEFWDWFSENSQEFLEVFESENQEKKQDDETLRKKNEHSFKVIVERLKTVNPAFSPYIGGSKDELNRNFIITVFGDAELFDEVDAFVNSAPQIEGWNFIALKSHQTPSPASVIRTGTLEIKLDDARFVATTNSGTHDVTIFLHKGIDGDTKGATGFARTITIDFLGERLAGTILGEVQIEGLENVPDDAIPLLEIKAVLEERE
ncbi:MAG: hypothetical protein ACKVJU_21700 [Verrucomicrobiales bacterium]